MNKNMNIKEATEKWVNGFNGIPLELIVKAYKDDIENIYEVTPITVGDRVWSNEEQEEMEVLEINVDEGTCEVVSYSDETFTLELGDISRENEDYFPMWGRMWTFGESIDNWWLEDEDNQRKMLNVGLEFMNVTSWVMYLELMVLDIVFMMSIGFHYTEQEDWNGTIKNKNI